MCVDLPRFVCVGQAFPEDDLLDCAAAVRSELDRVAAGPGFRRGATVAIAVGSRGIDRYPEIVASAARWCAERRMRPFIVPAMGSHAGGSAESQKELLLQQGIGTAGFPAGVRSSTETVLIGTTDLGDPLYLDRLAAGADLLILINRIKAHTDFDAAIESGLAKMLTVGLGKPAGAAEMHRSFRRHGFLPALSAATDLAVRRLPLVVGLAILENERHRCRRIESVAGQKILDREPHLLREAKQRMARLPIANLDLLIVEEIGKNISGSGMDTNVISRKAVSATAPTGSRAQIAFIYVRSLSPESEGNGVGIGLADFCHNRVLAAVDLGVTYFNCLTSGTPAGAAIPVHLNSDAEVIRAVAGFMPVGNSRELKIGWIKNTQSLGEFYVSEPVIEAELSGPQATSLLSILGKPLELPIDERGDIRCPFERDAPPARGDFVPVGD